MSTTVYLDDVSLPPLVGVHIANHLARLARASDLLALSLVLERAEGFVEGVEASRALTPAAIEALFVAIDNAGKARLAELGP